MSQELSDEEVLSQFVTYEPPPSGFDPLTAPDDLLLKYGFPHRPHAKKEPRLSKLWHQTLSGRIKMIKAELAVDRSRPRRNPLRRKTSFDVGGGWAGAQVNTASLGFNPPEPANTVYGQWIVPTVTLPPNTPPQNLAVGFWVGIGGDGDNNSTEVVQAGTQAIVQGNNVAYSAWTQWFPYQPNAITVLNFLAAPGDRVGFLVVAPQPDRAFASMLNYTTSVAMTVGIAPAGATNDGTSAEWIVEGDPPLLADFFAVVFGQCLAGTKNHDFDLTNTSADKTDEIISSNGVTTLAAASIILPNAVGVVWENPGP